MTGSTASDAARRDKFRAIAAVWEREGFSPGEALLSAETCLIIAGPDIPWSDRVAAIRARKKAVK
ncbi:hypothetical protein ACGRHY_12730 [Streptomyces sp. HK10]|uniref:hypothetical protein n=1 Tax=Streptomyces sp. HK10 TaxID=3373255 RepID=UPI00374A75D0